MRGRFRHTHIARDHGFEDFLAEKVTHFGGNLIRKFGAGIVHGQYDAMNFQ